MNSRERVLAAINHQPVDRLPTDIWATGEVMAKLRAHFGADANIHRELKIDGIAGVGPHYQGPPPELEGADYWGITRRTIDYGNGSYSEQNRWPLADAKTIDDLEAYRWPQADWFRYDHLAEAARAAREHQAVMCGYMVPFYLHNQLRGLEQSMIDPLEDPDFTHHLLQRISDFQYEQHRRAFAACPGLVDLAQVTDDYGGQAGPLIGLNTFREFYKPHLKRFCDLCHEFGIQVFHHDDGSCRAFLPDLVEIGIDILNPIQWTCPNMDMDELKRTFGRRICFHGAVDNQRILPFGTPDEVRAEVRHCIDALACDGTGYIVAPCHNLQVVSPVENIIAMYDEAHHYGREAAQRRP